MNGFTNLESVLILVGMVAVTYGIRLSFLVFGHRAAFPDWLERALRYVPAAVLTALIVPMALAPQGAVDLSLHNAYLPGTVAAVAVALWTRQTLAAILGGFVVYGLWRWWVA
jgi:branched-subunit amino acid transport protein